MDTSLETTIISTSGAVLVGIFGMWINANQTGKRIDDLRNDVNKRLDRVDQRLGLIQQDLKEFFKDITRLKIHTKLDG